MIYNLYSIELTNQPILKKIGNSQCPASIIQGLSRLELKLIETALNEQKNKIGYHKLGNAIRYNLSDVFSIYGSKNVLIKATENRRSVHKLMFEWLAQAQKNNIYLFVYGEEIGKKIVDGSTISIQSIYQTFEEVLRYFTPKQSSVVFIVEMLEFSDYRIEEVPSIEQNKKYYKLVKNG
jgi:hypothetical protein